MCPPVYGSKTVTPLCNLCVTVLIVRLLLECVYAIYTMFTYRQLETVILDDLYYCVSVLAVGVVSFGIGMLAGFFLTWI